MDSSRRRRRLRVGITTETSGKFSPSRLIVTIVNAGMLYFRRLPRRPLHWLPRRKYAPVASAHQSTKKIPSRLDESARSDLVLSPSEDASRVLLASSKMAANNRPSWLEAPMPDQRGEYANNRVVHAA